MISNRNKALEVLDKLRLGVTDTQILEELVKNSLSGKQALEELTHIGTQWDLIEEEEEIGEG